jgi:hypothetical protein
MRRMSRTIDFLSCLELVATVVLGAVAVRAQDAAGAGAGIGGALAAMVCR